MKYKFLVSLFLTVASAGFYACTDDDDSQDVGASVQPGGDVLTAYSNKVDVTTSPVLVDAELSKADYLYLGQYTDLRYGTTQCEYLSQIDARLGGVTLPNSHVAKDSTYDGVWYKLLNSVDERWGNIDSVTNASGLVVDSAYFYIAFDGNFIGDSTALQAIDVYALTEVLPAFAKHKTSINPSDYCDKKQLLGRLVYQVAGKQEGKIRVLRVPLDLDYANELCKVYQQGSGIKYQSQFNQKFPGVYVAHSFNEGAVIKITTSGIQCFYHFQGNIHTSYDGRDTVVDSRTLGDINPLVSTISLACNKSVENVNIFHRPNSPLTTVANDDEFTHIISPIGLYANVDCNFKAIRDSITSKAGADSSKITINGAVLKLHAEGLNWSTKLTRTPNSYMLLINRDSIENFFYSNKTPDRITSFVAKCDTSNTYSFDISRAVQQRLNKGGETQGVLENMVILPISRTASSNTYYYHQQLWPTATRIYRSSASKVAKRPTIDLVYTKRQ